MTGWESIREKNHSELNALVGEMNSLREELDALSLPLRSRIRLLSEKAELIRTRIRGYQQRDCGLRNDDERMRSINEQSKTTATLHYERWCDVDDSFIMENRAKMTLLDLAKHVGRTRKSVKSRIYVLSRNAL